MLGLDFAQTGGARDGVEHRYELQVRIPAKGRLPFKGLFYGRGLTSLSGQVSPNFHVGPKSDTR